MTKRQTPNSPEAPPGFGKKAKKKPEATPAACCAGSSSSGSGAMDGVYESCLALLDQLLRHENGWLFGSPVDARGLGLGNYYAVIEEPMDLGTVRKRLQKRRYASPRDFAADVRLTFRNALAYNGAGDDVHEFAAELSALFEARWPAIEATPPEPLDERKRLRNAVAALPREMHDSVADIIRKNRCACLRDVNSFALVDFDLMDAATFNEVDRFVTEFENWQPFERADDDADVRSSMEEQRRALYSSQGL